MIFKIGAVVTKTGEKLHFKAIEEKLHTVDNLKERSAVIDMLVN